MRARHTMKAGRGRALRHAVVQRLKPEGGKRKQETHMPQRLRSGTLAAGAIVLVAVSACGGKPASSTRPTTSPSVVPSTSAPTTPSQAAASDATQLLHRYFAVIDQISQQPGAALNPLASVATGTELAAEQRFLAGQHQRGERQIGSTAISRLQVQSVNLANSDPAAGQVPTVVIDVCWNVSKVDVLNRSGKSIVSSSRPNTGWTRYRVANYEYAAKPNYGWRVASAQDLGTRSCGNS